MARPPNGFQADPRYEASARGSSLFAIVFVTVILLWFVICFSLGTRPVEELGYVGGFPAWVFWGLIVYPLAQAAIFGFFLRYGSPYQDLPLDERSERGEDR